MTHTTNRDEESVSTNRSTRRDLANLLMPNVDGSWEPVPEITDVRELLELHWMLLGAAERADSETFAHAATVVGNLIDEALRCRTTEARDVVATTVRLVFEALRADLAYPHETAPTWRPAEVGIGWLTHLRLRNTVDQAGEADVTDEVDHACEAGQAAPRPATRRWRQNGATTTAVAATGKD